jgi:toxin ParE1/3/4
MNVSLPASLKAFVDEQVASRGYGTASEYVRELIRKDQDEQHLRALLLAGAQSGPGPEANEAYFKALREGSTRRWAVSNTPVVLRALAVRDVEQAVAWYEQAAGGDVREAFISALEAAVGHLARHPAAGSPRYAQALRIPALRLWVLNGFPYGLFYVELDETVDVWRVLHLERDVPASLRVPD